MKKSKIVRLSMVGPDTGSDIAELSEKWLFTPLVHTVLLDTEVLRLSCQRLQHPAVDRRERVSSRSPEALLWSANNLSVGYGPARLTAAQSH